MNTTKIGCSRVTDIARQANQNTPKVNLFPRPLSKCPENESFSPDPYQNAPKTNLFLRFLSKYPENESFSPIPIKNHSIQTRRALVSQRIACCSRIGFLLRYASPIGLAAGGLSASDEFAGLSPFDTPLEWMISMDGAATPATALPSCRALESKETKGFSMIPQDSADQSCGDVDDGDDAFVFHAGGADDSQGS